MGAPPAEALGQGYIRMDAKHSIVVAASAEGVMSAAVSPYIPRGHPSVLVR